MEIAGRTALVADELALARHGLRALLGEIGIAVTAETALLREVCNLATLDPFDIAVLGNLGEGLPTTITRLKALPKAPLVLALVAPSADGDVAALLNAGADGLARRGASTEELKAAVHDVFTGAKPVAPVLLPALVGAIGPARAWEAGESDETLSAREREVLALLAAGATNRQIAGDLSVSLATVKSHLARLYSKLGVSSRGEALKAAVARGLLA